MTTKLETIGNGVNLMTMNDVELRDLDNVNAWMFAFDLSLRERHAANCLLLGEGEYSFSNIKHRITVKCRNVMCCVEA